MRSPRLERRRFSEAYTYARQFVIERGFGSEITWQETRSLGDLTESGFLSESAWVILSSGMKEHIIRQRFPAISAAFLDWASAASIETQRRACCRAAMRVFRHAGKIQAIGTLCGYVAESGFDAVLDQVHEYGVDFLETFDFIGPVTRYHLGKNIGLDVVKPDRHLMRLASAAGTSSPEQLCAMISEDTGDRLAVIDVVLWRYATLDPEYKRLFELYTSNRPSSR